MAGEYPDVRIGTAERERALQELSDHFSAGRLSVAEFDERTKTVTSATTRSQLTAVFADLPSMRPEATATPTTRGPVDWRAAVVAVTPIAAVALFFILHSWLFFLLIPAVSAALYGADRSSHRARRIEQRRARRLDRGQS